MHKIFVIFKDAYNNVHDFNVIKFDMIITIDGTDHCGKTVIAEQLHKYIENSKLFKFPANIRESEESMIVKQLYDFEAYIKEIRMASSGVVIIDTWLPTALVNAFHHIEKTEDRREQCKVYYDQFIKLVENHPVRPDLAVYVDNDENSYNIICDKMGIEPAYDIQKKKRKMFSKDMCFSDKDDNKTEFDCATKRLYFQTIYEKNLAWFDNKIRDIIQYMGLCQ